MAIPVIKYDDGTGKYATNCFPVRQFMKQNDEGGGAWLVAHRAEQRRRFQAVLCAKPRDYAQIKEDKRRSEKDGGGLAPSSACIKDEETKILDGFFLMKHCCVEDPTDLCSVNISSQNLSEAKQEDFQLFDNVAYINASENLLPLECFKSFAIIRELELALNGLRGIEMNLGDFQHLELLDLSYNNLAPNDIIPLGLLPRLKVLHLSGNNLRKLPQDMTRPHVEPDDEIRKIVRFPSLEMLQLDDNKFSDVSIFAILAGLRRLQQLNLSKNEIQSVPHLTMEKGYHVTQEPVSARKKSGRGSRQSHKRKPDRDSERKGLSGGPVADKVLSENVPREQKDATLQKVTVIRTSNKQDETNNQVRGVSDTSNQVSATSKKQDEAINLITAASDKHNESAQQMTITASDGKTETNNQATSLSDQQHENATYLTADSHKQDESTNQMADAPDKHDKVANQMADTLDKEVDTTNQKTDAPEMATEAMNQGDMDLLNNDDDLFKFDDLNLEESLQELNLNELEEKVTTTIKQEKAKQGVLAGAIFEDDLQPQAPPFPQLRCLNLSHNKIVKEDDLLAVAAWPVLSELIIHNNPLTINSSGDPPLLKRFLHERLGICIQRKKESPQEKPHIEVPQKSERKIRTRILPVPRCNVEELLALEAPPHTPAITGGESSRRSTARPVSKVKEPLAPISPSSGEQKAAEDTEPDRSTQLEGDPFFMTQVDEPEKSGRPHDSKTKKTERKRTKGEKDVISDKYKGYEILLDVDESGSRESTPIPPDIQRNVRALQYALNHPLVFRDKKLELDKPQKPFKPHVKNTQPIGKPRRTKQQQMEETLMKLKERTNITEAPLDQVLNDRVKYKKEYSDAKALLGQIQRRYNAVRATSMKDTREVKNIVGETIQEVQKQKTM